MSRILVDTSVWIDFFRKKDSEAVRTLGELMRGGLVCVCGIVTAEVLSGARSSKEYGRLKDLFEAFPSIDDPPDLWPGVARARYRLARMGLQASIADLIVALTALSNHREIFTLEGHIKNITKVLPIKLLAPARH